MATVLIAETDPHALDLLPRILSHYLPQVSIDLCRSAEELCQKREVSTCETIVVNPGLFQDYHLLKPKWTRRLVAPVLVTADSRDRALAAQCLEKDAFDLIVKPLIPEQAVQAVKGALWQNKLLMLLASRDRATSIFRQHLATCPLDWRTGNPFIRECDTFERTFQALDSSLRLLMDVEDERSLFDTAALVKNLTRHHALERLLRLHQDGTSH